MGQMKKIYIELMRQREEDKEAIKAPYHLIKDPGGLSTHVLLKTEDSQVVCSGTMSSVKKYMDFMKIPEHHVFNFTKHWGK